MSNDVMEKTDTGKVPAGLTASQWESICALRPAGEEPVRTVEAKRSTQVYLSEQRIAAEKVELFNKVPVVATVSAFLPEPGMSVALDGYGMPLLITRDRQGVAHAFVNACRHRASKLVESSEPAKTLRVSCPYHAWTYELDGRLFNIPRHETFPSLNKEDLGLIPLATHEAGGFIWVGLDPKIKPQEQAGTAQICADMDAFNLSRMHVWGRRSYDLPANWKLVIEPFLEGYHVKRLHANSIGNMFADTTNNYVHFGHHLRQISGKAHFTPSLITDNVADLHKHVTHAYLVFPNTIIVTSPYYISVMILMPRGRNRTMVDYYMLVRGPIDNPKAQELYSKSYEMIHAVFGGEDFRAACIQQEALESGAIDEVHFGGFEDMIGPFHDSVESFLDPSVR